MKKTDALSVAAQGDYEIVMIRDFSAPRQLVFDAYTKPELLKRWLGVRNGWTLAECEVDLRVGGAYRYLWRQEAKDKQMGAHGVFREVAPPERLVQTESFDDPWYPGECLNTTTFFEKDGITTLTTVTRYESKEARDGVLQSPAATGIAESYDVLDTILAEPFTAN